MSGSEGVRHVNLGKDESPCNVDNFHTVTQSNENHSPHCETFSPSSIPADLVQTLSSRQAAISTALTLNYTQHSGESQGGISVPVLGVKGLISCSWFEERNCFCVCSSAYAVFTMMSHDAGSH